MSAWTTVTLSGVVGAGKSSAAKAIVQGLRAADCPAEHIRFQDFTQLRPRTRAGHEGGAAGGPEAGPGDGSDGQRWSGYQRRRLSAGIAAGYVARTVLFRSRVRRRPRGTVLVFDRYFYDSLVHFDLHRARAPLAMLARAIPAPTFGALLLVGERTLQERRTRYSAEYAHQVVRAYEELPQRFPALLVARTDSFDAVGQLASRIVAGVLAQRRQQHG